MASLTQLPGQVINAARTRTIPFALGFLGGIVVHNYLDTQQFIVDLPKWSVGNTSIGVADIVKGALDLLIASGRIPILGGLLNKIGGSAPVGMGMLSYLAYKKAAEQFNLPTFSAFAFPSFAFPSFAGVSPYAPAAAGAENTMTFPHAMAGMFEEPNLTVI